MKLVFLFILTFFVSYTYSQVFGSSQFWVEKQRTLINSEDGSRFTYDKKPFKPKCQLHFIDSSHVEYFDGDDLIKTHYSIEADTLILEKDNQIFKAKNSVKFVILQHTDQLTLQECKPKLDTNYLVRIFHFVQAEKLNIPKKSIETFIVSDKPAQFIGGDQKLSSFITKNIYYPKKLRKSKITGLVIVDLIIGADGSIVDAEIKGNPRLEFANETMRVIRLMPKWDPGVEKGIPIQALYSLPVSFTLQ